MLNAFTRFEAQIGAKNINILHNAHILLFGLGGVGGHCAEALARSGVGTITIVDKDTIEQTNLNRQLLALNSTIGKYKADVCKQRLTDINPQIKIKVHKIDFAHQQDIINFSVDYVIDAIDDVEAKIEIIKRAKQANAPIISCMGTGNKFNPLDLRVDDIHNSHTCPLAKIIRKKLKELDINNVKCVYSIEKPLKNASTTISSNAFVPAVAGILLARQAILDIIDNNK